MIGLGAHDGIVLGGGAASVLQRQSRRDHMTGSSSEGADELKIDMTESRHLEVW